MDDPDLYPSKPNESFLNEEDKKPKEEPFSGDYTKIKGLKVTINNVKFIHSNNSP